MNTRSLTRNGYHQLPNGQWQKVTRFGEASAVITRDAGGALLARHQVRPEELAVSGVLDGEPWPAPPTKIDLQLELILKAAQDLAEEGDWERLRVLAQQLFHRAVELAELNPASREGKADSRQGAKAQSKGTNS